jgi:hypothetical protein
MTKVYIKKESIYSEVSHIYKKTGDAWTLMQEDAFVSYLNQNLPIFRGRGIVNNIKIAAPASVTAETCQCIALYNNAEVTSGVQWSITSGGSYAQIDSSGLIGISSSADSSPITVAVSYNGLSTTHEMTVTYKSGSSSETTTETVVTPDGETITTVTTVTENEDGSSSSESSSTIYDEDGNVTGTAESTTNTNSDGSYESTTTNYDENGDPTATTNTEGDVDGNVSTQNIEYDENGDSVVVGYTIDTSENPDGEKTFNGEGVNTEYYAFDLTHGFELNIHFTINYSRQPAAQDENHHNILTMKRSNPAPWYGFQIRHSNTNKSIILGTQFATGSNTNTTLTGISTGVANEEEFDFTITYNPTASGNKFICYDNLKSTTVRANNSTFPDIDELKYLKVTIGCALDPNGNPYRYSNINVFNFSIQRI